MEFQIAQLVRFHSLLLLFALQLTGTMEQFFKLKAVLLLHRCLMPFKFV